MGRLDLTMQEVLHLRPQHLLIILAKIRGKEGIGAGIKNLIRKIKVRAMEEVAVVGNQTANEVTFDLEKKNINRLDLAELFSLNCEKYGL